VPTESVAENRHDPSARPAARLPGCPGEAIQADQALVVYRRLEYDSSAPIAEFSAQQMFI